MVCKLFKMVFWILDGKKKSLKKTNCMFYKAIHICYEQIVYKKFEWWVYHLKSYEIWILKGSAILRSVFFCYSSAVEKHIRKDEKVDKLMINEIIDFVKLKF